MVFECFAVYLGAIQDALGVIFIGEANLLCNRKVQAFDAIQELNPFLLPQKPQHMR